MAGLWLHVFHPSNTWTTQNWAVVLDTADKERGVQAFLEARPFSPLAFSHNVWELSAGMTIEAAGYDWTTLEVNGEGPTQED